MSSLEQETNPGGQQPGGDGERARDSYYRDMASSLGDKERVLEHLLPGTVLDVGSGGGVLAKGLLERGHEVTAADPEATSIPGVHVHALYADEVERVAPTGGFDNVMACAVLHEVFSYGNRDGVRGREANLDGALRAFRRSLRPGGRLVIRDGVAPAGHHARLQLLQWTNSDVERFLQASPFAGAGLDRSIGLTRANDKEWVGTCSAVMECAFTLTWGPDAFDREVQEFYGVFSVSDYAKFVEQRGFRLLHAESYTQPEYVEHLAPMATLTGFEGGFPHTNALWVYQAV